MTAMQWNGIDCMLVFFPSQVLHDGESGYAKQDDLGTAPSSNIMGVALEYTDRF